jgi:hypothetical protein
MDGLFPREEEYIDLDPLSSRDDAAKYKDLQDFIFTFCLIEL